MNEFLDVDTRMNVFQRMPWSLNAEFGLQDTTRNVERLRKRIESGDAELWRVRAVECDGWLVTQVQTDELFIWCYQGRGFMPLVRALARIALDNGMRQMGWFTYHTAALRLFRPLRPIVRYTAYTTEMRFTLNCEDLCRLPKTLIDTSPSAQSADTMSISDNSTVAAHAR